MIGETLRHYEIVAKINAGGKVQDRVGANRGGESLRIRRQVAARKGKEKFTFH